MQVSQFRFLTFFLLVLSLSFNSFAQVRGKIKTSYEEMNKEANKLTKNARNCNFVEKNTKAKKALKAMRQKLGINCGEGSSSGGSGANNPTVVCEAPKSLVNGECKCSDNLVWNINSKACEKAPSKVECSGLNISANADGTGCKCTSTEYSLISLGLNKFQCNKIINNPLPLATVQCNGANIKPSKGGLSCLCTSSAYILKEVEEKVFECVARANDSDPAPAPSYCQSGSGYIWDGVTKQCSCEEGLEKKPFPVAPGSVPPAPGFACAKPIQAPPRCSIVNSSYSLKNERCECNDGYYAKAAGKPAVVSQPIEEVSVSNTSALRMAAPTTEIQTKPLLIEDSAPSIFPRWLAGTFTCEKIQIIKPAPIPSCLDPKVYDATVKDCVCKPGYYAEVLGISPKPIAVEAVSADSAISARSAMIAPTTELAVKPTVQLVDSIKKPNYIAGKTFVCKQNVIIKPAPVLEPVIDVKPIINIKPAPVQEPVINVKPAISPILETTVPTTKPLVRESIINKVDSKVLLPESKEEN
jgi:hypothetical protein